MTILIKNVLLDDKETDVFVKGNRIEKISPNLQIEAEKIIDGNGKAIIPSFINGHSHAAMTLLRGFADDMPLMKWLQEKIWPTEEKLTREDVYWGTRLACLEMIKTGTTFFNEMYWHFEGIADAVEDSGVRAAISSVMIGFVDEQSSQNQIKRNEYLFRKSKEYSDRIVFCLGPHAIYTVEKDGLMWAKEFADNNDVMIHLHLCETKQEVDDCLEKRGRRPVEYLADIGLLGPNVIAAHGVWLSEKELDILKKHDVKVIHNPASNMKLAVSSALKYNSMKRKGIKVGLGTDGCSSNNNLDMLEEMKIASLLQKHDSKSATELTADEAFSMATSIGAEIFGLDCGKIEEGKLADFILVDLQKPELTPNYNLISNLVYSANGSCVDTTVCNGHVLMENRIVKDEKKILEKANEIAKKLA